MKCSKCRTENPKQASYAKKIKQQYGTRFEVRIGLNSCPLIMEWL